MEPQTFEISRDDALKIRGCLGKVRFNRRKKARDFATRKTREYGRKLEPYHCPHCGNYHVTTAR